MFVCLVDTTCLLLSLHIDITINYENISHQFMYHISARTFFILLLSENHALQFLSCKSGANEYMADLSGGRY